MEKTIEIPEGYEARIEGNKVILEPKESEDERIRKALMQNLKERFGTKGNMGEGLDMPDVLTWLEKQGKEEINEASYRTGIKRVLDNPESYGLAKQGEQDSAWSEEDERLRNSCIAHIEDELKEIGNDKYGHSEIISDLKESCRERINWIKSLKDRVKPQPKSEWSEEDEKMLQGTIDSLRKYQLCIPSFRVELQMRWLSSLKNRI